MTTPTLTKLTDDQICQVLQHAIMTGISRDVVSPVQLAELYGYSTRGRTGAVANRFKMYGQKIHRTTGANIITVNFPLIAARADYQA
jgi:hypothetical protein